MHHHQTKPNIHAPEPTRSRYLKLTLTALAAATVAACGGGHPSGTSSPEGQWTTGDLHVHTVQSDDSRPTQTLDVVLGKAFKTYGLDWMAVTNHLRSSKYDNDGNALPAPVAFSYGMEKFETPRIRKLQAQNTYADKVVFSAYEWDMPARDHVGIGIFDNGTPPETSFAAVKEFQYLFTTGGESLFDPADLQKWKAKYPQRFNQTGDDGLAAIKWLSDNYPKNSYAVINHPSRNPGKYTPSVFRQMNDINPNIVFAIEGMVGNQLEPNRGGYTSAYTDANLPNRTYGGTDYVVARLGGVWDSLLGEGRRIWNVADSDSHFEIDANDNSSGYFPGEYAKNYVWRPKGSTGIPGLIDDIRAGRVFGVFGDLISALDFDVLNRSGKVAFMGQELKFAKGETAVIEIRFKSPPVNNYQRPVASGKSGNMTPKVDHIDLIVGDVGKKFAPGTPEYESATNPSTRVLRRFTAADWKVDDNGYCVMKLSLPITKNQYFRLRGTNLGVDVPNLTSNGEPLPDQPVNTTDAAQRHDQINDRNYGSIWFYSNPIFVTVE